jgi:hypothetical protein
MTTRELEYQLDEFNSQVNEMSKMGQKWQNDISVMNAQNEIRDKQRQSENDQTSKTFDHLRDGLRQFANPGVMGFMSAMQSGQSGMAKYSQSLSSMIGSVGTASKMLGFLSGPIGLAVTAISSLVGAVLQQNDKILESFDDLADIGVTAGMTAEQLDQIVDKSQGNLKYIKSFTDSIKKLGGNLLILGKTTAEGTMKFAEITRLGSDVRDQFRNLGLSQEQVNEMQADYVKQYALMDGLKDKDARQIRAASLNWIKQTMALTAVTGMTKEQQEEANKALEADVATQVRLQSQKPDMQAGLRAQAQMFEQIKAGFGKDFIASATIGHSGNEQFEIMMATYFDKDTIKRLKAASSQGMESAVEEMQKELVKVYDRLMDSTKKSGMNVNTLALHGAAEVTGMTSDFMELLAKSKNAGSFKDVLAKMNETSKQGDNLLKLRNETINLENKFTGALQKFIRLVSGPVTQAFNWIARSVNEMLDAMMENTVIAKLLGLETENKLGQRYTRFNDVKSGQVKLAKLVELQTQYEADLAKLGSGFEWDQRTGEYEFDHSKQQEIDAKRKELDQIKQNRRIAEDNIRSLKEQDTGTVEIPTPKPSEQPASKPQQQVSVQIQTPPVNKPSQTAEQPQKKPPELPQIDGDKLQRTALQLPPLKENEPQSPFYVSKPKPTFEQKKPDIQPVVKKEEKPSESKKPDIQPVVKKEEKSPQPVELSKAVLKKDQPQEPITLPKQETKTNITNVPKKEPVTPEPSTVKKDGAPTSTPSAANGGVLEGPKSGYIVEMHGLEAVVPLSGNRTIPVEFTSSMVSQIKDMMSSQMSKIKELEEMVNKAKQQILDQKNTEKYVQPAITSVPQKPESSESTQIILMLESFFDELLTKMDQQSAMAKEIFASSKR